MPKTRFNQQHCSFESRVPLRKTERLIHFSSIINPHFRKVVGIFLSCWFSILVKSVTFGQTITMKHFLPILCVAVSIAMASCSDDYKTTESGLEYKIVNAGNSDIQPNANDIVAIRLTCYSPAGQMVDETPLFKMQVREPATENPSIDEGLLLMHKGDSAVFRIKASLFGGNTMQNFGDSLISVSVKMVDVISYEEFQRDRADARIAGEKEEEQLLDEYLQREGIDIEPTISGLYYIELRKGDGPAPIPGKMVTIHYEGSFLNDQVFDSSYGRREPLQFKLGKMQVIQGLEEGVARMRVGGRSRLIIPSPLAYGDEQVGPIPPFATLIFDVELIDAE